MFTSQINSSLRSTRASHSFVLLLCGLGCGIRIIAPGSAPRPELVCYDHRSILFHLQHENGVQDVHKNSGLSTWP